MIASAASRARYLDAKADNRLDGGIDPAWLTPEREGQR